MKWLSKQAQKAYGPSQRLTALTLEGAFFLIVLPWGLVTVGHWLDNRLGLPALPEALGLSLLGGLLALAGFALAFWAVYALFIVGEGTPAPLMATQRLILRPPYTFCRNPMALGTMGWFLGIAILARSPAALIIAVFFSALHLGYIKWVEEKELAMRFGEAYEAYRRETPFIIPRWRRS